MDGKWQLVINAKKTTYTQLSLSTRKQKVNLKIRGQSLPAEDNPRYLGVTFDQRLTWKPQIDKAQCNAKLRLTLMKKLAGTSWGADATTLKRLYTGRVRPTLEYGITAWGTAAKSNFNKVSKIQNQATRIITGAMKSTSIMELLDTVTGLEPLKDRRDTKILVQAAKFKRLPAYPPNERKTRGTNKRKTEKGEFCSPSTYP